jgi:hypothetical protein
MYFKFGIDNLENEESEVLGLYQLVESAEPIIHIRESALIVALSRLREFVVDYCTRI